MRIIFWASVAFLFYTYFGYAVVLMMLAGIRQTLLDVRFSLRRANRRRRGHTVETPTVSFLFSAYNEEGILPEKMRNIHEIAYPGTHFQVLVGCDGCTDQTADYARAGATSGTEVYEFEERSGKPAVINRLVQEASGDILVFTDANTM